MLADKLSALVVGLTCSLIWLAFSAIVPFILLHNTGLEFRWLSMSHRIITSLVFLAGFALALKRMKRVMSCPEEEQYVRRISERANRPWNTSYSLRHREERPHSNVGGGILIIWISYLPLIALDAFKCVFSSENS